MKLVGCVAWVEQNIPVLKPVKVSVHVLSFLGSSFFIPLAKTFARRAEKANCWGHSVRRINFGFGFELSFLWVCRIVEETSESEADEQPEISEAPSSPPRLRGSQAGEDLSDREEEEGTDPSDPLKEYNLDAYDNEGQCDDGLRLDRRHQDQI